MTSIGSFLRRADLVIAGAAQKAKLSLSVEWDSPKGWKEGPWLQMDDLGSRAWSYGPGEFPTPWKEGCLVKGRYPAHVDLDTISTATILAVLMLRLRYMSQACRQGCNGMAASREC